MKNKIVPKAPVFNRNESLHFELPPRALEMWNPDITYAADSASENVINVLDVIGADYYGEGITAKTIAAKLRSIGDKDVTVLINSPGGDLFEGLAIYSLLREHPGIVTVKILGVAASAGSVIGMAGDVVQISRAGFFMIHNAWVYAAGNRNDMRAIADYLEPFDRSMAGIYAARTGDTEDNVLKMMDAESWINASDSLDQGFADSMLDSDEVSEEASVKGSAFAARKIDLALAKSGMPRSERRKYIQELKAGKQDAASHGMQNATNEGRHQAVSLELGSDLSQLSENLLHAFN